MSGVNTFSGNTIISPVYDGPEGTTYNFPGTSSDVYADHNITHIMCNGAKVSARHYEESGSFPQSVCFSCNTVTGQCSPDPDSTTGPGDCSDTCKCVAPNNCGQLNGTSACGAPVTGCNVCDKCCQPFITTQDECDLCVNAPDGCPKGPSFQGLTTERSAAPGHRTLPRRIEALEEMWVLAKGGTGGYRVRVAALEHQVIGEQQTGTLRERVAKLELESGLG
jgi:hypothetical protein